MNNLHHISFIMDGNGRWGKKRNKSRNYGHLKGVEVIRKIIRGSLKLQIPIVSFYVFSSENWKRPKREINFLFNLIESYFSKEIQNVIDQGIKIRILGEKKTLPKKINKSLKNVELLTKKNKKIIVNLAINYGSKNEILNSFKKIKKKVNIKSFEKNLYTQNMPDPDILIRTGGQKRLSNFMLWQLAYSELFFLNKLWPDFKLKDLSRILRIFKKRKRNFGAI